MAFTTCHRCFPPRPLLQVYLTSLRLDLMRQEINILPKVCWVLGQTMTKRATRKQSQHILHTKCLRQQKNEEKKAAPFIRKDGDGAFGRDNQERSRDSVDGDVDGPGLKVIRDRSRSLPSSSNAAVAGGDAGRLQTAVSSTPARPGVAHLLTDTPPGPAPDVDGPSPASKSTPGPSFARLSRL